MPVASGIETTLRTLLRSANPAATDLLVLGLGSDRATLRVGAVRALALRPSPEGHRKLVEQFKQLPPDAQAALLDVPHRGPLLDSLTEMINPRTPRLAKRAVEVAVAWGATEVLPAVVEAVYWPDSELTAPAMAQAALTLAHRLEEAIRTYDPAVRHDEPAKQTEDPAFARRAAVNALAMALDRYDSHECGEVLEAMLLLTPSDEPALTRALRDPSHAAHERLLLILRTSSSYGAIGVLAGAFRDLRAPQALLEIAAERCDLEGLEPILERVGHPVGATVRDNMTRLDGFAWLAPDRLEVLLQLSGKAQATAMALAAASDASRRELVEAIMALFESGQLEGRLAAARALESVPSHLAVKPLRAALESGEPSLVATAAKLLRRKEYPCAAATLVSLLDHDDAGVRAAGQGGLKELSFGMFRDQLHQIPEDARERVGRLVAKADPMAAASLRAELSAGAAERRVRALELIDLMGLGHDLAGELIERLEKDSDTGVRAEVARLLGRVEATPAIVDALERSQQDSSPAVRKASGESLLGMLESPLTESGDA